jgi:methyl-accepting chemotaxis protein
MKISTVLAIGMLIIGGVAFIQTSLSAARAIKNYKNVEMLSNLANLRNSWVKGVVALSVERSVTQLMLTQEKNDQGKFAPIREEQQAKADEHFRKFRSDLLNADHFPNQIAMMEAAGAIEDAMGKLRSRLDRLLALPLEKRDAKAGFVAINHFKAAVSNLELKADLLTVENDVSSSTSAHLLALQKNAWLISEYAGRAQTYYAIATLAQKTMSPGERASANADMLRATDAWNVIGQMMTTPATQGAISTELLTQIEALQTTGLAAFDDIKSRIDRQMDEIDKIVAELARVDGGVDGIDLSLNVVSFDTFLEVSDAAIHQAIALAETATDALSTYWKSRSRAQLIILLLNLMALGVTIAVLWLTARVVRERVTDRLGQSLADLSALASGNLSHPITRNHGDLAELVLLSDGLENLQAKLRLAATAASALEESEQAQKFVVHRLSEGLKELASGNLSGRITDDFGTRYQTLADDFNSALSALCDLVTRVIETSGNILSGSGGINQATMELSKRTETQGATLQNAAAALEELTQRIIASQTDAQELNALASKARTQSIAMNATMQQTVQAIEKIKVSSNQIAHIVDMIEDIAFQTSILALNAGVESKRAGEAGSGFAFIASEVRSLAVRSAKSAQDIKSLIATSVAEVTKGVENVAEAETSVGEISLYISKISGLISDIALAAEEQSRGLVKVNDGVSHLDLVTQTNVAMVEETTAECEALAMVAQDLSQLVSNFRTTPGAALSRQRHAG